MSSATNNISGSNNNSMGPPPNQQPRQPPSGGNGHRKSSSLNRGWFEGTMEVISGMAPRPVTPSQNLRPASAPNSPARGFGIGLFGGGGRTSPHHHFPPHIDRTNSGGSGGGSTFTLPNFPISRLPSQDSLDRSIHNESGHGKSTAQIIRDLKHSNSALSAKMASLEKRHMNELAQVEAASSSKRQELEQIAAKQKMKLMQYEQYKTAAESKMKQQDAELSKIKEESAFQRHSISDLKNQLFQLQQELDERDEDGDSLNGDNDDDNDQDNRELRRPHSDDGHHLPLHPGYSRGNSGLIIASTSSSISTDDIQQMALDNEELVKEIQELQDQLMEYQGYDKKLIDLQRQLEAAQKGSNGSDFGIPPRPTAATHPHLKNQPERERPPLVPSKSRDQDESVTPTSADLYRMQLQDAKEELEAQTIKLNQHESSVRDLEAEKESLAEAHSRRVRELEERFVMLEKESNEREVTLRKELSSLSQQEIDQIETRLREEQQEHIVELEEQLEQYAEKLAEVAATLAESRQQAKNQEQYRKDEAEDLRMIQDAHEAEIVRLEKELDEVTKELELRDEELEEVKQKHSSSLQREKEDEKKSEVSDAERTISGVDNDKGKSIEEVTNGISIIKEDSKLNLVSDLEEQLYDSKKTIQKLELQLGKVNIEHKAKLSDLEKENTKLASDLKIVLEKETRNPNNRDGNSHNLHHYWEEKTSKTKEVDSLKSDIEGMRQRLIESTEAGKLAEQKAQDLEIELQKYRSEATKVNKNKHSEELKHSKTQIVQLEDEIVKLKATVEESNILSVESKRVKKELQEAQVALVDLDDGKQAMSVELNELVSSLEKERKIRNEMTVHLERQKEELTELQNMRNLFKPLQAEKLSLQEEVKKLNDLHSREARSDSLDLTANKAEDIKKKFDQQLEDLNEENGEIKTKLKDRDTTIATLLRSSVVLENKIDSLHSDVNESRANHEKAVVELRDLRSFHEIRDEEYSRTVEEIKFIKGQLRIAKADCKRWRRALKEDGTTSGEYRYQISMLQKANEDFAETIQERDQAIQNLVNQSMGQESHVRDLKIRISSLMKEVELVRRNKGRNNEVTLKAEIDRLQEESEIFAGQIIEQDEEFKRMQRALMKREEQIGKMKIEMEDINRKKTEPDESMLEIRDRQISELKKQLESIESERILRPDVEDSSEVKNLRAELDELQEAAESNRVEIRDLRQQLWEAKEAAGTASDLRVQLDQAKWQFDEYKQNATTENKADSEMRTNLDKALARIKELEDSAVKHICTDSKLNDIENELSSREIVIEELREQLSRTYSDNNTVGSTEDITKFQEEMNELNKKNNDLKIQLQSKIDELNCANEKLESSRLEVQSVRRVLQSWAEAVEELVEEIKASQNETSETEQLETIATIASQITNGTKSLPYDSIVTTEYVKTITGHIKSLREEYCGLEVKMVSLQQNLEGKTMRITELEDEIGTRARDVDKANLNIRAKANTIDHLEQQLEANQIKLKEASDLKAKLGNELADSQARLGALERELFDAITATSSNEELSKKNQSLVQENASLSQKNEFLVSENTSMGNMNDNLIDESETLTKDNQILCEELRALNEQKIWGEQEIKTLSTKTQSLDEKNKLIIRERDELSERLESLSENVLALKNHNDTLQHHVDVLNQTINKLECENLKSVKEQEISVVDQDSHQQELENLSRANESLRYHNVSLSDENMRLSDIIQNLNEKNHLSAKKIVEMEKSIKLLKADTEKLSQETSELDQLKLRLDESQTQQELSEKTIIEKYEEQLQSLSSSKDAEMDALRNCLADAKETSSENMDEMMAQLRTKEEESMKIKHQFELELEAKRQQIFALEHTLHAQEQIVDTMRSEMDQIQSGMEHATKARRNEVEEMQQEVMHVEGKAMKQEREIVALKMQLEERKLEHKADVVKLKDALAKAMEQDSPLKQTISDLQNNDRMLEVRERLEQLKARNTDLQEENLNLGGRLERAAIQINAFEIEKHQAEEIEEENTKLRNQLKEYEQLLSRTTKSSMNAMSPQRSSSSSLNKNEMTKLKDKKKKKFGIFRRRSVDEPISEGKEEEEC